MKEKVLPDKKQQTELVRYAHAARYAYNWALRKEKEAYRKGQAFLLVEELQDTFNHLKKLQRYHWLCDIPEDILNLKIKEAAYAYKNFLSKATNCPRYKKKENDFFSLSKEKTEMFVPDDNKNQCSSQNLQLLIRQKRLEKRRRRIQRSIVIKYEKNKKGSTYCKTKNIIKKEKELDKLNKRLTNIQQQVNVLNRD